MGISIAELLVSGDSVLSVLLRGLVVKDQVQVQPWLFLETLLLFFSFAKSGTLVIFLCEGDFASSAQTIRHFCRDCDLP